MSEQLKLSEALILKAEWWLTPYYETDEINEVLGAWKSKTRQHINSTLTDPTQDHTHRDNDSAANLCLLEAELQKDEESQDQETQKAMMSV